MNVRSDNQTTALLANFVACARDAVGSAVDQVLFLVGVIAIASMRARHDGAPRIVVMREIQPLANRSSTVAATGSRSAS